MKMKIVLLFFNVALVWANDDVETFLNSNREFSANVYKELAEANPGNFVGSPITVGIILSLLHAGAREDTAAQLAESLSLPNNRTKINSIIQTTLRILQNQPNLVALKTATKIYIADDLNISKHFENVVVDVFKSAIEIISFQKPKLAADIVNKWISEQINNHVKDVISDTDVNAKTQAILVNALYFEASWLKPFSERNNKKTSFYVNETENILVDMLNTTESFEYCENYTLKARFLKLPYVGNNLSMVVILPMERDGLLYIESNINETLQLQKYEKKLVHINIPKFKIDTAIKFVPILHKLGIIDLFTPSSDLRRIGNRLNLSISDVFQKNYVEVNENGTKAASATVAVSNAASLRRPEKEFIADRPFFYYVESAAGILFFGRFAGHL